MTPPPAVIRQTAEISEGKEQNTSSGQDSPRPLGEIRKIKSSILAPPKLILKESTAGKIQSPPLMIEYVATQVEIAVVKVLPTLVTVPTTTSKVEPKRD